MKHMGIVLLILTILSSASAQSSEFIGGALGLELGPASYFFYGNEDVELYLPLLFEVQAGDYNLFGPFGFRQFVGTNFYHFELGGDLLIPLTDQPRFYLGAGAGLTLSDSVIFNVRSVAGVEFELSSRLGFFNELNLGYYSTTDNYGSQGNESFGANFRFGYNVHP